MTNLFELTERYCERIERELEDQLKKIDKSNPVSVSDMEIIDTLWHSLKSIKTVAAMLESYEENGYSGRYQEGKIRDPRMSYGYSGNSNNGGGTNSYSGRNRNRDSMGRYSGHNDGNDLMVMLEEKMRYARSEDDAMAIRNAIDAISRY